MYPVERERWEWFQMEGTFQGMQVGEGWMVAVPASQASLHVNGHHALPAFFVQ
ncbi:MAG: hypothetical protein RLZZ165_1267 [Bacteroidota bacterium]|jgi:hypothetical protein